MACPICKKELSTTALRCPSCGAEKRYGPSKTEELICAVVGAILVPSLARLATAFPLWPWALLLSCAGMGIGFTFAQFKFTLERWVRR